ncbi:MAG TPA: DUF927 domain-containing protein [Magnetospirillum sp.]|nr:DUF927 domain-containing protein [Magnetospirillum sp.]
MILDLNDVEYVEADTAEADLWREELFQRLRDAAAVWVKKLYPCGRLDSEGNWRVADIYGRSPRNQGSFVVTLTGPFAGHAKEWGTDQWAGAMDMVAAVRGLHREADAHDILNELAVLVGMPTSAAPCHGAKSSAPMPAAPRVTQERQKPNRSGQIVLELSKAIPAAGTLAEAYLAKRGVAPTADILFSPDCADGNLGRPAMICLVRNLDGEVTAIHRTFLREDGSWHVGKKMLGDVSGGAIRLGDIGRDGVLGVAEGVETALSASKLYGVPVWACGSTTHMEKFRIPASVSELWVFADGAEAGEKAALATAERAREAGVSYRIIRPRTDGGDFNNDLLSQLGVAPLPPLTHAPLPESEWGQTTMERGNGQRIEIMRHGVRLVTEKKDKKTGAVEVSRAPVTYQPISAYALTVPADTEADAEHGLLVKYRDVAGRTQTRAFPASFIHEPGDAFEKWVAKIGVKAERPLIGELLNYFSVAQPVKRITAYSRTGWQESPSGRPVFVIGDTIIGDGGEAVFQPAGGVTGASVSSRGTLENWRSSVAIPACASPGWRFGVMVSLAAPLLKLLDHTSFIAHLAGRTSTGKTITLRIGASCWGRGDKTDSSSYLRSWNNTGNAVEAEAAAHSDLLLCLDELGEADSAMVGNVVYAISDGSGRGRLKSDASMRKRRKWRVIALSSGEQTVESKIAESGKRMAGGMAVRAFDILTDNTDFLPTVADAKRIEDATVQTYGTAGPAFVQALVEGGFAVAGSDASISLKGNLESAERDLVGDMTDSRIVRAARSFALIRVAGDMAVKWGILPEDAKPADTVKTAFELWAKAGASQTDDSRQVAKRLLPMIESEMGLAITVLSHARSHDGGINLNSDVRTETARTRLGWSKDGRVWLLPDALNKALNGYMLKSFLDAATGHGAFIRGEGSNVKSKVPLTKLDPLAGTRAYQFSLEHLQAWVDG